MEEILDQLFDENNKDETWINWGVALIRLLITIRFCYFLFKIITSPLSPVDSVEAVLFVVIPASLLLVVIHSFYRTLSEFRQHFVMPKENRIIALFMVIFYLLAAVFFLYVCAFMLDDYIGNQSAPSFLIEDAEPFLLALGFSVIAFREIIYYQRRKRLKQLNNQ